MTTKRLSVLISSYDNTEMTVAHVKKCMESSRIPDEIIVVNDGGDDKLRGLLKDMDKKCDVIYAYVLEDIPWNQCGARNLGFWISKGDYISVEDNDHFPTEKYYENALELLKTNDRVRPRRRYIVEMKDVLQGKFEPLKSRGATDLTCVLTRELFIKLKGYDEKFCGHYGWEAPDWIHRINRVEGKTVCSGEMYVVIDGGVKIIERRHDGKNFMMDKENYWELRRNNKALRKQSTKGVLNFNYDYERFV
jgi:glycosyltransferase involved in cell wall biosynthesis